MKHISVFKRLMLGGLSYDNARGVERKLLVAIFVLALLLFSFHLVASVAGPVTLFTMKKVEATVVSTRSEAEQDTEYPDYATVRYDVAGKKYTTELVCDPWTGVGRRMWIYCDPDHPEKVEEMLGSKFVLNTLLCLWHLGVAFLTRIPHSLLQRKTGIRTENVFPF